MLSKFKNSLPWKKSKNRFLPPQTTQPTCGSRQSSTSFHLFLSRIAFCIWVTRAKHYAMNKFLRKMQKASDTTQRWKRAWDGGSVCRCHCREEVWKLACQESTWWGHILIFPSNRGRFAFAKQVFNAALGLRAKFSKQPHVVHNFTLPVDTEHLRLL